MDVNDVDSVAFQFLRAVYVLSGDHKGTYQVRSIGWDMGLANNEIRDVLQHLEARGLLEWRSGSRGWRMSDRLSLSAVVSERGREHVEAILARAHPAEAQDA